MTYGYWISRARVHLGDAAEQLAAAPAGTDIDLLAIVTHRVAVYRQLERNVEILLRRTHNGTLRGTRRHIVSLFARARERLHVAAADSVGMPSASSQLPAAVSLTSAVDCLGVAADILASHLLPQPRTPEGVSIRLGDGVAPAMADLARAGLDAIAVDQALLAWLTAAGPASAVADAAVSSARRATTSSLPSTLADVIASAPTGARLVHGLTITRATGPARTDIETTAAATATLREARTWLWQNPDRVHTVHLRLGAELGLAASELRGTVADPAATRAWRRAVGFVENIEGSPATEQAAHIANQLAKILDWTRSRAEHDGTPKISDLVAELPALAGTLLDGVSSAAARGDVFVNRPILIRGNGGISRAKGMWRRATLADDEIVGLRTALAAAASPDPEQRQRSPARLAFQRPPQPGTGSVPRAPGQSPWSAPRRRRARS